MSTEGQGPEMSILRRAPILDACRDGPKSRRELEQQTDYSRTTIYRATVELEERGLLEKGDRGYQTTAKGDAMEHVVREFLHGIETVDHLEPLFDAVSHPELLEKSHLLSEAQVTVADEDHIYRANDRIVQRWRDAEEVRMCAVSPGSRICLSATLEATIENDVDVEMYFRPDARPNPEQLASDTLDSSRLLECADTYVSDAIPFTFALFDDSAIVAGHNEVNIPVVVAESEDPRVYEWLDGLYADAEAGARPTRPVAAD